VFNRFGVQKSVNEARDEVRRAEVRQVAGTVAAKAVKKSRWALLKKSVEPRPARGETLREVQRLNRRLYLAYLLKESLAKGMGYRQPARATRNLDNWSQRVSRSKLNLFVRLSRTVRRHKHGIVAYTQTGLSNGVVEGLNNKIRPVMRRAYGFRNTARNAMVFLCCGALVLNPPLAGIPVGRGPRSCPSRSFLLVVPRQNLSDNHTAWWRVRWGRSPCAIRWEFTTGNPPPGPGRQLRALTLGMHFVLWPLPAIMSPVAPTACSSTPRKYRRALSWNPCSPCATRCSLSPPG